MPPLPEPGVGGAEEDDGAERVAVATPRPDADVDVDANVDADADAGADPIPTPNPAPGPAPDAGAAAASPPDDSAAAPETAGGERSDVALLGTDERAGRSPVAEPPPANVLESPNWVLVQDPARQYTVQMIASTERASVETFLAEANLSPPNSIFSFDRRGTTWYALVHGLFPSIDAARRAVERMPPEALSNQPWIRAVGRIQSALKEQG